MSAITVTDTHGQQQALEIKPGMTLMELLRDAGYEEIVAMCGGCCSCATCHLHVLDAPQALPPIEEDEAMLLELADSFDERYSRLSCQIKLDERHAGMHVQLVEND